MVVFVLGGAVAWGTPATASAGVYDDVAVIVNTASPASMAIGAYFQQARAIPEANMIRVWTSTAEETDDAGFSTLRQQVEAQLAGHPDAASINYLVTTKGLPLKVNREPSGGNPFSTNSPSSSIESELACMGGTFNRFIGQNGRTGSPYYAQKEHFSRAKFGIYLVTRLDGYTVDDVCTLIDRSGPGSVPESGAEFVLDQDPTWNASLPYLNENMRSARTTLAARGRSVYLNADSTFVTERRPVLGYVSWGSNDHATTAALRNARPGNLWSRGSIAETYVSTSGRSFDNPPCYGQSLVADLVQEGVTAAKGYVYEPYSSSMANAAILFDRYTEGYSVAESYFMASCYLSWMDVVVGDPKSSIAAAPQPLPIQLGSFSATPVRTGAVRLDWRTLSETNNFGFAIQRSVAGGPFVDVTTDVIPGGGTTILLRTYSWTDETSTPGPCAYRLRQIDLDGTEHFSEAVSVTVATATGVSSSDHPGLPTAVALRQNYPNPFNPSTTIGYDLPAGGDGRVELTVYDQAGRLVETLVRGEQQAGTHAVQFNAGSRASGTYYAVLRTSERTATQRMILLK